MKGLFENKPLQGANMSSGNQNVISSLQRLLNLLIAGNSQSIDTAIEVEFLLKHRQDSVDTPMEIKELINNISKNIQNIEPQLKENIDYICKTLEAACQQNSPSPRPTGP